MSPDAAHRQRPEPVLELAARLRRLRTSCGNPSVRDLERMTERLGDPYPRSTINDKLNGLSLPSWQFVRTFLAACARLAGSDAPRIDFAEWQASHQRMMNDLKPPARSGGEPADIGGLRRPFESTQVHLYEVAGPQRIGIITGDIRRVRCADVWVNPENTTMRMARVEEFSISAIIRYEGAGRDDIGQVVEDQVADELDRKVADRRPVPAGAAIVTGAGELRHRNGVRYIVHVAAVQGEPGAGFRQVREIGRCLMNALTEADRIEGTPPIRTILVPLLGTGQGGGETFPTATALISTAVDFFTAVPRPRLTTVYFLAYTDVELTAFEAACAANQLARVPDDILGTPERGPRGDLTDAG